MPQPDERKSSSPDLCGGRLATGVPTATIALAVEEVFKNVSAFICHYHFLKSIGKNLFGEENDILRELLRKHNVRAILTRTKKRLEKRIAENTDLFDSVLTGIECQRLPDNATLSTVPVVAAYTLISWILDSASEGNGFGFPFDQSYLALYQRIREAGWRFHQLFTIQLQGDWKENKVYSRVSHDLHGVLNDSSLQKAASRMEEKVAVFNRLRTAMRITLPQNKRGLNDNGELPPNMKTIEKEVGKFTAWLLKSKGYSEDKAYQKLVEQIDTYSEKLFADPIVVKTAAGRMLIQPQRTNNILERFFRSLMRSYRKKNGFNSVERVLKTMLPDTPLTMNLKNQEYMKILLAGKETLEERFAETDSKKVHSKLAELKNTTGAMHPQLKKIIRTPELPKSIVALLEQIAS